jgi:hypothetical protein
VKDKNMKALRIGCVAAILTTPALTIGGANLPSQVEGHRSGLTAQVVAADGTSRTVKLQGIGCSESMCSRVFLRSKAEEGAPQKTWLDSIASIRHATGDDALLVMKDGSEHRVTLVPDFRVLYVSNAAGLAEKLDLDKIRSLEFVFQNRNK